MTPDPAVQAFYTAQAPTYGAHYAPEPPGYPGNRLRFDLLIPRLKALGVRTVLDCGCGEGSPAQRMQDEGFAVQGFDFTPLMVEGAKAKLGYTRVWTGDIQEAASYRQGGYDAVLYMGSLQHVSDDFPALAHGVAALKPGGSLFVECRNALFDLFTFNRRHWERMADLLPDGTLTSKVLSELSWRMVMDLPPPSAFEALDTRWHNPLTFPAVLAEAGAPHVATYFFHWHAVPPMYEALDPAAFRAASLALEADPLDWRGHFMCSAFIAEGRKL